MLHECYNMDLLSIFLKNKEYSYHLRELSRLLCWGPGRVKRHIKPLIDNGLIKEEKFKIYSQYKINTESDDYNYFKRLWLIDKLRPVVRFLDRELMYPRAIVLTEINNIELTILGTEKKVKLSEFEKEIGIIKLKFKDKIDEEMINGTLLNGRMSLR